jgi:hypothetical protein
MKKFLSSSLSGLAAGVGDPLGEGEVPTAGAVVVVVVAGDIPGTVAVAIVLGVIVAPGTAGVMAGAVVVVVVAGDMTGAAGLMAAAGGAPGGFVAGDVGGGVWPNEVSARVTEQRLAISSVFIGLIGKFSRARVPMS